MKTFLKLSLFGAIFMIVLSGVISQAQETPITQLAMELESSNPVPDTKVYVFLRQFEEEFSVLLAPVSKKPNGTMTIRISAFSKTAPGKPDVQSFIFELSRSKIEEIKAEATCLCYNSPAVSMTPYAFAADSLGLDDPLISLYVMSDGKKYGPYAVRPLEVKELTPIRAFDLQNELKKK